MCLVGLCRVVFLSGSREEGGTEGKEDSELLAGQRGVGSGRLGLGVYLCM
jgi:hypothetical protein